MSPRTKKQEEAEEDIVTLFKMLGTEGYLYELHRIDDRGRPAFVTQLQEDEVSVRAISNLAGGGRFKVVERSPNDAGKLVYSSAQTFTVEGEPKVVRRSPAPGAAGEKPEVHTFGEASGASGTSLIEMGILQIFQGMQDGAKMNAAVIERMLSSGNQPPPPPPPPPLDIPAMILAGTALMKELRGPDNTKDPLDQLRIMGEIVGSKNDTPMESMVGMFRDMLEIKTLAQEPPQDTDPMMALVHAIGPQIAETVKAAREADPKLNQPTPAVSAIAPPEGQQTVPLWVTVLNQKLPELINLAARGRDDAGYWMSDPALYGDVLLDQLPEAAIAGLRDAVADPSFGSRLYAAYPALGQYQQWFDELIAALNARFSPIEPDEDGDETPATPGAAVEGEDAPTGSSDGTS